jgi:hypothetical protein
MTQSYETEQPSSPPLPIFYTQPRPVNGTADAGMSLLPVTDFGFARVTNSVVLGAAEFPRAMRNYPIVFTTGEAPVAVAVLGLGDRQNLFVGDDGKWLEAAYIPAYVRRYPFIFLQQPEHNELTLCIDVAPGLLTASNERLLFENGEPTQLVRDALTFCRAFNEQTAANAAFVASLAQQGLLTPNQARIVLEGGREMTLRNFQIVDEARLDTVPDDVYLDWRRRGWLQLLYCHLLSAGCWAGLAELAAKRGTNLPE